MTKSEAAVNAAKRSGIAVTTTAKTTVGGNSAAGKGRECLESFGNSDMQQGNGKEGELYRGVFGQSLFPQLP